MKPRYLVQWKGNKGAAWGTAAEVASLDKALKLATEYGETLQQDGDYCWFKWVRIVTVQPTSHEWRDGKKREGKQR